MGYPTKVQLIKRKSSEQWYINFPSAVARAMEFSRGEIVEWVIEDKAQLLLRRKAPVLAKKKRVASSNSSSSSSMPEKALLAKKESLSGHTPLP